MLRLRPSVLLHSAPEAHRPHDAIPSAFRLLPVLWHPGSQADDGKQASSSIRAMDRGRAFEKSGSPIRSYPFSNGSWPSNIEYDQSEQDQKLEHDGGGLFAASVSIAL